MRSGRLHAAAIAVIEKDEVWTQQAIRGHDFLQ